MKAASGRGIRFRGWRATSSAEPKTAPTFLVFALSGKSDKFIETFFGLTINNERFKKHFSGDADTVEKLDQIIDCIKQKDHHDMDFYGITIEKIKPWFFIRLRDGRSKSLDKRKVSKSFRFKPETVDILKSLKDQTGQSETEILENLIATAIHSFKISCVIAIIIVGF